MKNTASFDLTNTTESAIVKEYETNMQTDNVHICQDTSGREADTSRHRNEEAAALGVNAAVKVQVRPDGSEATEDPTAERDVFDKLSKTLDEHASQLAEDERQKEHTLRGQVVDSLRNFHTDRLSLGRSLSEYKSVFKSQRQWTRVAAEIGAVIKVSSRTVFRMIDDYESSVEGPKPTAELDTIAIHGAQLSSRERYEIRARLAIRAMLDDIPVNEKAAALGELLAEEAYQIWGKQEKFSIVVTPRQSRFTIDGRKKGPRQTADEVAA